jgi:hypothetical protein
MGEWTRAKACSSNSCIEVRAVGDLISIRVVDENGDVQPPHATPDEWAAFIAGVKAGDFDHITEEASI